MLKSIDLRRVNICGYIDEEQSKREAIANRLNQRKFLVRQEGFPQKQFLAPLL